MEATMKSAIYFVLVTILFPLLLAAGTPAWVTMNGPEGGLVQSIVVDKTNPKIVYALFYGSGLYKTTNGGETWRKWSYGLSYVNGITVDPTNSKVLYAGTLGVVKSTNGGKGWSPKTSGLPLA